MVLLAVHNYIMSTCMYSLSESLVLSSHERKYLTFKLIESLLPSLSSAEVCACVCVCVCVCV